jgi:hypothetical protein
VLEESLHLGNGVIVVLRGLFHRLDGGVTPPVPDLLDLTEGSLDGPEHAHGLDPLGVEQVDDKT